MAVYGAIQNYDCEGTLTIAGTSFNNPAIMASGLSILWGTRVDYRGTDRVLPFAQGTLQYPRWRVATRHSIPLLISGYVTTGGVAASNPTSNLATLLRSLLTVTEPPDPTTGVVTRAATLVLPNAVTLTANIIPLGITPGEVTYNIMRATLDFTIPAGRFA